jgi:predicted Zn finger-like uncharacterized protein
MLTTCPECRTTFRVTQEQLGARRGMVRCGRCNAVFNAYDNLQAEIEAAPGVEVVDSHGLRPMQPPYAELSPAKVDALAVQAAAAPPTMPDPAKTVDTRTNQDEPADDWLATVDEDKVEIDALSKTDSMPDNPHLARLDSIDDILLSALPGKQARGSAARGRWTPLYWSASVFLTLLLLFQVAYFLRVELANWQPLLRPAFSQICQLTGCVMPLATDVAALRIEASSLETDPEQAAYARLRVTFSNRSAEKLEWPHFILKLSNVENVAMAQRVFKPRDYLPKTKSKVTGTGMAPHSEHEFQLDLDLGKLSAAGYEVKPYYP